MSDVRAVEQRLDDAIAAAVQTFDAHLFAARVGAAMPPEDVVVGRFVAEAHPSSRRVVMAFSRAVDDACRDALDGGR